MSYARGLLLAVLFAAPVMAQDDLGTWITELKRKNDDVDVKLITKIAATRTREAAEALVKSYDAMQSTYMRREIARALGAFDGAAEAEQPALQKLANIAGNTDEPEVREAAIHGLGQSTRLGKHFLKQLVDSQVPDSVREAALAAHVKMAAAEDATWYKFVWNLRNEHRKNPDGTVQGAELSSIRELAFKGLMAFMTENEFVEALRTDDLDPKIRRLALKAMDERDMPKTAEMAKYVLDGVKFPGVDRAEAARLYVKRDGTKAVPDLIELAKKAVQQTPEDLRLQMAKLIVGLNDDATNKKVQKLIGKGKPHERVFALEATEHISDPKVVDAIRKELQAKEVEVRAAAGAALGKRRDKESLPELRNLLTKSKQPEDARIAIDAIGQIEQGSAKWLDELVELCKRPDRDARNAALEQLAARKDAKFLPVLCNALAHDDWTTRLCAIDGLVALRHKDAVPRLIDRLEHEQGRIGRAVGDALWQLTGQPFDEDLAKWRAWWPTVSAAFEVISPADLEKAAKERELRRLQQRTRAGAKFFGIRIESHRVIFIIDISGSMLESVYGRGLGKWGTSRIDVAKQELTQAIKNLDEGALFNVFAFSSGVARWQKDNIGENNTQSRQAALTWVERLGAAGGTNLYDSVKMAFADKDVDTIFIMSDGEPTVGEVIDPWRIREDVAFWNQHRKVKINTIMVGGNFEVLEWLATDSGGTYVQIR